MLTVLLVDDEALARAGLKHSIMWDRYDMCVSYEASCVDEALSVIRDHADIDLVFTDIVMPVKNGLELLRGIRDERPMLPVVVLTYHNDFSFVREALRLGAIDYINKTELNHAALDESLRRIEKLAKAYRGTMRRADKQYGQNYKQALYVCGSGSIALPSTTVFDEIVVDGLGTALLLPLAISGETFTALDRLLEDGGYLLAVHNTANMPVSEIIYRIRVFCAQEYFYARLPNLRIYEIDTADPKSPPPNPRALLHIREDLSSFFWINDQAIFERILDEIAQALFPPAIVYDLFFGLYDKWRQLFGVRFPLIEKTAVSNFDFWYQWVDWVSHIRRQLLMYGNFSRYSPEISGAVQKLLLRLNENPAEAMSLSDAAAFTNLSVSYFTRCFHDITDRPYMEYIRNLRIEYGRKLLTQTNLSVSRVAELCGLPDPFHFSKLFKRYYGHSPTAYRNLQKPQT